MLVPRILHQKNTNRTKSVEISNFVTILNIFYGNPKFDEEKNQFQEIYVVYSIVTEDFST